MSLITSDRLAIVVGLGQTGLSVVRHLVRTGRRFAIADTREHPPGLEEVQQLAPDAAIKLGPLDPGFLSAASEIYLSPGVAKSEPAVVAAVKQGVKLSGDIDLFCQQISAPVVAITGSNAKSTVTTLVADMARKAGVDVALGGNIGVPVLDLLEQPEKELYVLELSSFQLETTHDLRAKVATVLNISPDHMDRYDSVQDYYLAKHRIFRGCEHVVVNAEDPLSRPLMREGVTEAEFTTAKPDLKQFGLLEVDGKQWLAKGFEKLLPLDEMKIKGQHNAANAMAAIALGEAVGLGLEPMLAALREFPGLKHRCQWVAEKQGVLYFNDSKGTNVGATVAALNGLGGALAADQKIVLIAGGDGKGASFEELNEPVKNFVRGMVLIGRDSPVIEAEVACVSTVKATDMDDAVSKAAGLAEEGDLVLLSPACASFDMYSGYPERGDKFVEAVNRV